MKIKQGDIFWTDRRKPKGSEPGYRHPYVVVQNDVFNASAIQTAVCCQLTTNLFRAQAPGNILIRKGEGNLAKPSVVNISQVVTFDKSDLQEKIGTLSKGRVAEIIEGLMLLLEPREI